MFGSRYFEQNGCKRLGSWLLAGVKDIVIIRNLDFVHVITALLGSTAAEDGKGRRVQGGLDMAGTFPSQRNVRKYFGHMQQKVFVL